MRNQVSNRGWAYNSIPASEIPSLPESLASLRASIADPSKWFKGGISSEEKDADGIPLQCCLGNQALSTILPPGDMVRSLRHCDFLPLLEALCAEIPAEFHIHSGSDDLDHVATIANFNDHPSTTHADMVRIVDAACAKHPVEPAQ